MVDHKNEGLRRRQQQTIERNAEIAEEIQKSKDEAALIEENRRLLATGSMAFEWFARSYDSRDPFGRDEFLARLDASYQGWRDMPPFPELDAEALADLAAYLDQIADELQDHQDRDGLHSVFVSLDNQAGTASRLRTVNTMAAVVALLNALELADEEDADHSALIFNCQIVAVECLRLEAQAMRERATENHENKGE